MWAADQIVVDIVDADHPVVEIVVTTPMGDLRLMANASIIGRTLHLDAVHVDGLIAGALGRSGLNAIGRKLLEVADVDEIIIQGGTRTTGKYKGTVPRPIRFPRRARARAR
jgi:hypothetical protein